jgi:hypothetical protein
MIDQRLPVRSREYAGAVLIDDIEHFLLFIGRKLLFEIPHQVLQDIGVLLNGGLVFQGFQQSGFINPEQSPAGYLGGGHQFAQKAVMIRLWARIKSLCRA